MTEVKRAATWIFSDLRVGDWFAYPHDITNFTEGRFPAWQWSGPEYELVIYVKITDTTALELGSGFNSSNTLEQLIKPDVRVLRVQTPREVPLSRDSSNPNSLLVDLFSVGPKKPLGYLPCSTLRKCKVNPEEIIPLLVKKGLKVFRTSSERSGDCVVVYDKEALQALIDSHPEAFTGACINWPHDADAFAVHQSEHTAPSDESPGMYYLIAKAYSDWRIPKYERGDWD